MALQAVCVQGPSWLVLKYFGYAWQKPKPLGYLLYFSQMRGKGDILERETQELGEEV